MITRRLNDSSVDIAIAAEIVAKGGLVAFPTETVYGLGADATDPVATAKIYAAKGRPSFNPLIAHVADLDAALNEGVFDRHALALAKAFWPGPLTLVVPVREGGTVCELARAGLSSVALRVPSNRIAHDLLKAIGRPVAAPSANRSGHVSPTTPAHVLADLDSAVDAVIDGGGCNIGIESTIVACVDGGVHLLRTGGITRQDIIHVLGRPLDEAKAGDDEAPQAPGSLAAHYAPRASVRLNAEFVNPGEALLAFGPELPRNAGKAGTILNLSQTGDLIEAAANLYHYLRSLDATRPTGIAVAPIPAYGLGEALGDRLKRAAAGSSVKQ